MISYCIKRAGGEVLQRCVTLKDIRSGKYDKRLCEQFIEDCNEFDRLIGWYSSRFDVPFIRSRCLYWGVEFPVFGSLFHTDAIYIARHRLKLHSNRLEAVCDHLGIPSKGHRLTPKVWWAAGAGDKKALEYVLTHNVEDVISTEAVWNRLKPYTKMNKASA